uniref:Uncharacterized protein n=1 Tax=Pristionchus pacificus TaxID=54126 RepID=A0A2A6C5J7_PRIPA|eukprot:PDM73386.1 hypothetical protein PRIPAC_40742 [Pristionchus pacificus]
MLTTALDPIIFIVADAAADDTGSTRIINVVPVTLTLVEAMGGGLTLQLMFAIDRNGSMP